MIPAMIRPWLRYLCSFLLRSPGNILVISGNQSKDNDFARSFLGFCNFIRKIGAEHRNKLFVFISYKSSSDPPADRSYDFRLSELSSGFSAVLAPDTILAPIIDRLYVWPAVLVNSCLGFKRLFSPEDTNYTITVCPHPYLSVCYLRLSLSCLLLRVRHLIKALAQCSFWNKTCDTTDVL